MSAGAGALQRRILAAITSKPGTTADTVLWDLAVADNALVDQSIPKPYYGKIRRSIISLEHRGTISVERRRLTSLSELVQLFPYKTLRLSVRDLRMHFLPIVVGYVSNLRSIRFSRAANERFIARDLSPAQQSDWADLRQRLLAAITASPQGQEALINVLIKGDSIFSSSIFNSDVSLIKLLGVAQGEVLAHEETQLVTEIIAFYSRCLPRSQRQHVRLKSELGAAFIFSRQGRPNLNSDFTKHLLTAHYPAVSALPGHRHSNYGRDLRGGPVHYFDRLSPVLRDVITGDAFRQFAFLTIP